MPSVMICTPSKDGRVDINYAVSLAATGLTLQRAQVDYRTAHICSSSIDNARSILTTFFMASPCTHLMWVDDDMSWAPDLVLRMLEEDMDIIGVPYRKKKEGLEYTVRHASTLACLADRPWLALVDCVGMGMTLIKRSVFEGLKDDSPTYHCYASELKEPQRMYFRHELMTDDKGEVHYESEDFNFCRRAKAKGFEVWALMDENVLHVGRKAFGTPYSMHVGRGTPHGYTSDRARGRAPVIGVEQ